MNNIVNFRKQANLSQLDLSRKIGVTQGAIGHYESGRRVPDLKTCREIVSVFNSKGVDCTLDDVFPPLTKN